MGAQAGLGPGGSHLSEAPSRDESGSMNGQIALGNGIFFWHLSNGMWTHFCPYHPVRSGRHCEETVDSWSPVKPADLWAEACGRNLFTLKKDPPNGRTELTDGASLEPGPSSEGELLPSQSRPVRCSPPQEHLCWNFLQADPTKPDS